MTTREDFDVSSGPLVQRYLDHVRFEKRLADRTWTLYAQDLTKLQSYAAEAGIHLIAVQSHHIRRWVAQMHGAGRSGRGIALILSGWRGFYGWLMHQALIVINPVSDVRAPKAARPLPKAMGVDDAVQLASFQNADMPPWFEIRDAAMVELLYGSGLRVAELTGLDVGPSRIAKGWVDLQTGEAHVLGKGSKRRIVPVGTQSVQALRAWLQVRSQALSQALSDTSLRVSDSTSQNALFVGHHGTRLTPHAIWQRLRQRSLDAGLPVPVHPHMLRHSFASHILQSSSDIRGVQELLGHASIRSTQIYTQLDFQHLARAYDAAHPRAHAKPVPPSKP